MQFSDLDDNLKELISIVDEYYTFLTTFYIPASALKRPPPGGWPNITNKNTAGFGKSQCVIDLLKFLPYIDDTDAHQMITNIHYKCDVVDYSTITPEGFSGKRIHYGEMGIQYVADQQEEERKQEEAAKAAGDATDDEPEDSDSDSAAESSFNPDILRMENMFALAKGYESGGRSLVLDVVNGTIHEDVIRCNQIDPVDAREFFEGLRRQFETLEMVPVMGELYENVSEVGDDEEIEESGVDKVFKRIYRQHGWPGTGYRKEEALEAVERERERLEEAGML
jgi:hypothetical protein